VEASGWGCRLSVDDPCDEPAYIGIRAHTLTLADENQQENVLSCWPIFTSETPHRVEVYLRTEKSAAENRNYDIQWELSKEDWSRLKTVPLPWKIYLNPDKIFCMKR
jgi:ABC-type sulfate/molybdate transport systems ATPase subunit